MQILDGQLPAESAYLVCHDDPQLKQEVNARLMSLLLRSVLEVVRNNNNLSVR